jgi:hypothetical protein
MDLGEELQIPDTRGPRDGDLGVGIHRECHHAVDVGGCQPCIVERIQHGLRREPQFATAGILREIGRSDTDDRRLARQFTGHQAPPIVNVAFAIT